MTRETRESPTNLGVQRTHIDSFIPWIGPDATTELAGEPR